MARRSSKIDLDLFPFLSVLCGIIGVLMLFILLITTTRVIARDKPPPAPPNPTDVEVPEDPTEESGIGDEDYERLDQRVQGLTAELNQREQRLADLRKLLFEFEDLVASKEDEALQTVTGGGMLTGVPLEKPDDVDFVEVTAVTVTKRPRIIEVSAEAYTVHPEKQRFAVAELEDKNSPLSKFLAQADKGKDKKKWRDHNYFLFLVHVDGAEAFSKIKDYLVETYPPTADSGKQGALSRIDMGWEPFSEGWLLVSRRLAEKPEGE